jgi:hypothetical protein
LNQTIDIELPPLYGKQHRALYNDARYSVVEGSTKCGKTHGCLVWQIGEVFAKHGDHWWVAPVHPQAKIAFARAKRYIPRGLYTANDSEQCIRIAHPGSPGEVWSTWWFKSGEKPDNLYGEDVYSAVIDEASRIREASWHAVRSTLTATRGPLRIIGNVKGRGSWFYRMARKAQQGADGYSYHKITAYDAVDAGVLDAREIEDAKQALPEHVFKELFLAEPADDGGNPFGLAHIDLATTEALSSKPPVVWGWDVAKSYDWTVGIALDEDGAVCRFERFQKDWRATKEHIAQVTKRRGLIDSTGVGDPILEDLRHMGAPLEGFKFTSSSKQQIMEGLATAIQQGLVRFPDGVIVRELEVFEYEYTRTGVRYSAPPGLHDDCVCALALAVHAFGKMARSYKPRLKFSMAGRRR